MNEKIAEKGIEFLETAIKLAQGEAPKLLAEFMNFMIFQTCLSIIQKMGWLVLLYFLVKVINTFLAGMKTEIDGINKKDQPNEFNMKTSNYFLGVAAKQLVIVGFSLGIVYHSVPQIVLIGKILIAPKVFLIQEGANILKDMKK